MSIVCLFKSNNVKILLGDLENLGRSIKIVKAIPHLTSSWDCGKIVAEKFPCYTRKQYIHFTVPMNLTTMSRISPNSTWEQAIYDAKHIIGKQNSDLSMGSILFNEFSNTSPHFKRLVTTEHPFIKTIKNIMSDETVELETRGVIVLLLSKSLSEPQDEVSSEHRSLAEITELVYTAQLMHESIAASDGNDTTKLSLLSGDFLLATACRTLASLKCNPVVDLISTAIMELNQAPFMGAQDSQGRTIPQLGSLLTAEEWERMAFLHYGSLLANSCKSAAILAKSPEPTQMLAYNFGRDLALAWQAHQDLQPFVSKGYQMGSPFNLASLPVLLHLSTCTEDLDHIHSLTSLDDLDYAKLHDSVTSGEAVKKSKALLDGYIGRAQATLDKLPESSSTKCLSAIVQSLH